MQEQYLPIMADGGPKNKKQTAMNTFSRGDQNRRRRPRFQVEGEADLVEIGVDLASAAWNSFQNTVA